MPDCEMSLTDRLPELLHERLPLAERDAMLTHVADCGECAAELALLRDARAAIVASAPRIDVAAIARAVARETAMPAEPALHIVRGDAPHLPSTRRRPMWANTPLRIAAGITVAALGVGGVLRSREAQETTPSVATVPHTLNTPTSTVTSTTPAPTVVASLDTPSASRPAARAVPAALGATFADLSDDELDAIVRAIDDEGGALPLDPEPIGAVVKLTGNP